MKIRSGMQTEALSTKEVFGREGYEACTGFRNDRRVDFIALVSRAGAPGGIRQPAFAQRALVSVDGKEKELVGSASCD